MLKIAPAELHELVTDVAAIAWNDFRVRFPDLSTDVPMVRYNNRLKTTGGMADFDRNCIELCTEMLWEHGEEFADYVIRHEFGHLVAHRLFGDIGHGSAWKAVMRSIGASDSPYHKFVNSLHEARKLVRMAR